MQNSSLPHFGTTVIRGILSKVSLRHTRERFPMELQTPLIGIDLPIDFARQFALDQIGAKASSDPDLVNAFWDEVSGATPPARPDITVFYCFLRLRNSTFTLLEFVSGQTLEQLCTQAEPASCEKAIPLFTRLLDACDASAMENRREAHPAPEKLDGDSPIQLSDFGIARASSAVTGKLYGTVLIRPDGSWAEEILSERRGRSAAYPLLMAVYKELVCGLPEATALIPAQLDAFSKRSLASATAAELAGIVQRKALPYAAALGVGALLTLSLFGIGHILAKRVDSSRGGLRLPPHPAAPVAEVAAPIQVTPVETAPIETLVINDSGLTRGAQLIRQIGPKYPKQARENGISGSVKLELTIAEDGSVWGAKVLSGDPLLAEAALSAVKKWAYRPALASGKPLSTTTEVEIKFDLEHQP